MSDDQALEPNALALLTAERSRPEIGGAAADRIFAQLTHTIATGAAMGASARGDAAVSSDGNASTPPAAMKTAESSVPSIVTSKLAGIVLAAFVAGIGVGAVAQSKLGSAPPPLAPLAPTSTSSITAPPASTASASPAPSAIAVAALPSVIPRPPSTMTMTGATATAPDKGLARERAWIDQARMALARGSAADALSALDSHAREFPSGRMTEEREALAVHALSGAGRADEARARAQVFRARWPSSVFLAVVDRAAPRSTE